VKGLQTSEEAPPLNGHERRRAATRQKVLTAAREIVAEEGREGLTVVGVAARAGVSEGTVYKIFASRDDLAAAATLGVSELWIDAVAGTPGTQHPLRRILRAHRELTRDVPEEELLLRTIATKGPRTTTELGLRYQAQDMLARSCAAGLTRSPRSKLSSEQALLWAHVYVAALRTLRMMPDHELAEQFDVLETYLHTLLGQGS
jgi:AcrR family transcriptional regulator